MTVGDALAHCTDAVLEFIGIAFLVLWMCGAFDRS